MMRRRGWWIGCGRHSEERVGPKFLKRHQQSKTKGSMKNEREMQFPKLDVEVKKMGHTNYNTIAMKSLR